MDIVFASNNAHKLKEMSALLPDTLKVLSLAEVLGNVDIPETGSTLAENAVIKARYVYSRTGMDCFADDTGLEVDALNGAPGVFSARYAGENCSFKDNVDKVLRELAHKRDRKASFRTVICLMLKGEQYMFEGKVEGELLKVGQGVGGFGYDPIFCPIGFNSTFAEMILSQKNLISHRGRAFRQLAAFLRS